MAKYTGCLDRAAGNLGLCYRAGMTSLVFQLHFDVENRIGPGKIELLEKIEQTGSISAAGRAMNMSYRRAWLLVDAMNRTFHAPVVATRLGGTSVGRAKLTPLGHEVVQLYRQIGQTARNANSRRIARLEELIAEGVKRAQSFSVTELPNATCAQTIISNSATGAPRAGTHAHKRCGRRGPRSNSGPGAP
jgi:molybdate transport system regulatory protein